MRAHHVLVFLFLASCQSDKNTGIEGDNNDNNRIVVGENGEIDESTTHNHYYEGENGVKLQKGVRMLNTYDKTQVHIGKLLFPLKIIDFIAQLGEPTEVELPDLNDPSPWGQVYKWNFESKNIILTVLTDDYDNKTANYNAGSRFFTVSMVEPHMGSDIKLPLDTKLGMPIKDLEKNLSNFTKEYTFWHLSRKTIWDDYGNEVRNGQFIVTNDKFYMTFITDGRKLTEIIQSSFNYHLAD